MSVLVCDTCGKEIEPQSDWWQLELRRNLRHCYPGHLPSEYPERIVVTDYHAGCVPERKEGE